ncbi:MAG TPA: V-type ATP synthase subunit K [Candidatus Hydrogenedentes bacterium]|nr:V-type ATP synthase subunit K [Candidatus Hydrogenedentota bacterium]HOK88580.1 V-type ATP synthase subunit K [Candidatus Hydrogenedentota bacterium]
MDLQALSMGLTVAGAGLAVGLGCAGSAKGIGTAAQAAGGVLSEKPHLFGRLLVLLALPGTQGFYGFITMMMIMGRMSSLPQDLKTGVALLVIGFFVGVALLVSAIWQGQASAASIAWVARREGDFGKSLLLPAMVETYAVVGLLAGILALNSLAS